MNKYVKSGIQWFVAFVIVVSGVIISSEYFIPKLANLTVKVCYDTANIQISRCQSFENGCINPKLLLQVISDSPGAKAYIAIRPGFYAVTDGREYRVSHVDAGDDRYEAFGCTDLELYNPK